MHSSIFFLAGAFVALASAQSSISMPPAGATSYPINIGAIPSSVKDGYCTAQKNSCIQLCEPGGYANNTCISETLAWNCTCNSGNTPNLANFNETIPFFECQVYIDTCVNSTDIASQQAQCRGRQCGNTSVLPVNYYTSSASSASTSSATKSSVTAASTSASTTSSPNSGPAATAVMNYGLGALVGGVAAVGLIL